MLSQKVDIQLKEDEKKSTAILHKIQKEFGAVPGTEIRLFLYYDLNHGMGLDYERKFRHIVWSAVFEKAEKKNCLLAGITNEGS